MKRFKYILLVTLLVLSNTLNAQKFESEIRRKGAEDILNCLINSACFDSIYHSKRVYFMENELLKKEFELDLRKNNKKVYILDKKKLGNKEYVVLEDILLDWDYINTARVMISVYPIKKMIGCRIVKFGKKWRVYGYTVLDIE